MWTITIGQSKTSPIVNWCIGDFPPHSFESSSLLEEASSSWKGQRYFWLWGRVLLWVLNGDLLLMLRSIRSCFTWMRLWCLPCVWFVGHMTGVSQTRPNAFHRINMRVTLGWRVLCHEWVSVVSVQFVLVRVLPIASVNIVSCSSEIGGLTPNG